MLETAARAAHSARTQEFSHARGRPAPRERPGLPSARFPRAPRGAATDHVVAARARCRTPTCSSHRVRAVARMLPFTRRISTHVLFTVSRCEPRLAVHPLAIPVEFAGVTVDEVEHQVRVHDVLLRRDNSISSSTAPFTAADWPSGLPAGEFLAMHDPAACRSSGRLRTGSPRTPGADRNSAMRDRYAHSRQSSSSAVAVRPQPRLLIAPRGGGTVRDLSRRREHVVQFVVQGREPGGLAHTAVPSRWWPSSSRWRARGSATPGPQAERAECERTPHARIVKSDASRNRGISLLKAEKA